MILVYFLYGLAFFSLGLAVSLEARRASRLPLGQQLPWLAAFGLVHSVVEWSDMFLMVLPPGPSHDVLLVSRTMLLPLSTLLLVRFGIGLISEAGPLPDWLTLIPLVLLVPGLLLIVQALVVTITQPPWTTAADVWSRYLLYFPGSLLASFGFVRQWRGLPGAGLSEARNLMLGVALAFLFNAFVAGLIVPTAPYGLAPWINYDRVLAITGVPVQVLRMLSAVVVTLFVLRALGVFEAERQQQIAHLQKQREQARRSALQAQFEARQVAESWTDALVDISRNIADMESVDSVLLAIVESARRLLNADTAALGLWDETKTQFNLKCYATTAAAETVDSVPITSALILETVRMGNACRYPENTRGFKGRWNCPVTDQEILAAAIVPLQFEDLSIGGLWIGRFSPNSFTQTNLIGLEHLADQAVIAIEHALMAERLQSLAIIEERNRLAHEMHDGLVQILGYLNLEMQTLKALVRQGNVEGALAELNQARQSINTAQADVRESILSLRTTLAGDAGLIPALREYSQEFGVQTGIEIQLINDVENVPHLSPLAETQLVRIFQEALANVRKHARARRVWVHLTTLNSHLCLSIHDDGVGFGPDPQQDHFGLQFMYERAESVGGNLMITSRPNQGTVVELRLPLVQER